MKISEQLRVMGRGLELERINQSKAASAGATCLRLSGRVAELELSIEAADALLSAIISDLGGIRQTEVLSRVLAPILRSHEAAADALRHLRRGAP